MAANDKSWLNYAWTAFLFIFGVFSAYVVWFAMNNKELVGADSMFYEVFFGALALFSFLWVAKRVGIWPSGNNGSPTS